ncbi:hypothetical protein GUA87_12785 [Sneathiella sp. P13V-1]|uniref:BadF/BadG/BcrA/BcrD ATPase family protein n=1 Tax=Sneathiella sp. P13V-1 TaxID=2697366 RepID=UPI00187B5EB3|nr:BadF/BadG/BcrA/BcrD ATPase family protein [Sneathiella sp. P13V-1]MBE7637724.1 hypothetical protein [Sneathiella sp. P13V-1]
MQWQAEPTFFVTADCGGSKCRVRIYGYQGNIISEGIAGPSNISLGADAVIEEIVKATRLAISQSGIPIQLNQTVLGAGIAGLVDDAAINALQQVRHPFKEIKATNDAHIAYLGAIGAGRDGAIIIFGTGSCVYGTVQGQAFSMGGWGLHISDQASGARLGKLAVRYTLQSAEGIAPSSELTELISARIGNTAKEIYNWSRTATPSDYADLAPYILRCSENKDETATAIVNLIVREAEQLIAASRFKGISQIALIGGLAPEIRKRLSPEFTTNIVAAKGDPLEGAQVMLLNDLATVTVGKP